MKIEFARVQTKTPQINMDSVEHISAVESEILAYNLHFKRLLTVPMNDVKTAMDNIGTLQTVATNNATPRNERVHAMAIMYLILTLSVADIGGFLGYRLHLSARIRRLVFIRDMNTYHTAASETWPQRRARGLLREALDMYHQLTPERTWWSAAHGWINKVLIIHEHIHADTIGLFISIIWGLLHTNTVAHVF